MIPFDAYTEEKTHNACQWAEQPPKLPVPREGSRPPSNMVPRAYMSQPPLKPPPPKRHLDRFTRFHPAHPCAQHT